MRNDRSLNQIREVQIIPNFTKHAEGSVLISIGETKVICTATVEDRVPPFLRGQGKGWVTAEYSMLPRATQERNPREAARGKLSGRTMEIQRLIGRALRSVVDLEGLGERTLWIDCDVIQADGGTRTASITGAYVAMLFAFQKCLDQQKLKYIPVKDFLAATSVGVLPSGEIALDLCYEEDAVAIVDMNIVMTGKKEFVELQGTGEEHPFSREQLIQMLQLGEEGVLALIEKQKEILGDIAQRVGQKPELEQAPTTAGE